MVTVNNVHILASSVFAHHSPPPLAPTPLGCVYASRFDEQTVEYGCVLLFNVMYCVKGR